MTGWNMNIHGISLVELMLALSILSIVCGVSIFIFHQSATFSYEVEWTSTLLQQLSQGVQMIRWDMLSTQYSAVNIYNFSDKANFPHSGEYLYAWIFPTGYDKDTNEFKIRIDGSYEPDWQGGIVYCPYRKDENSPRELRRYSFYEYPPPFVITEISGEEIIINDDDVKINRNSGETTGASVGDPKYRVAVSNITDTKVVKTNPIKITLTAGTKGRLENRLSENATLYISPRN